MVLRHFLLASLFGATLGSAAVAQAVPVNISPFSTVWAVAPSVDSTATMRAIELKFEGQPIDVARFYLSKREAIRAARKRWAKTNAFAQGVLEPFENLVALEIAPRHLFYATEGRDLVTHDPGRQRLRSQNQRPEMLSTAAPGPAPLTWESTLRRVRPGEVYVALETLKRTDRPYEIFVKTAHVGANARHGRWQELKMRTSWAFQTNMMGQGPRLVASRPRPPQQPGRLKQKHSALMQRQPLHRLGPKRGQ